MVLINGQEGFRQAESLWQLLKPKSLELLVVGFVSRADFKINLGRSSPSFCISETKYREHGDLHLLEAVEAWGRGSYSLSAH